MTMLDDILRTKREEVVRLRNEHTWEGLLADVRRAPKVRSSTEAIRKGSRNVIAEFKRASPSRGVLNEGLEPSSVARQYAAAGAAAISVLTDAHYFKGSPDDLRAIREAANLPILRKDFILDEFQVAESRAMGADIILLIVRILSDQSLKKLLRAADDLGMGVLVEVHEKDEIPRALKAGARMVGVNNRDLDSFNVSLDTSLILRKLLPSDVVTVSESGIQTPEDARRMFEAGYDAVLVGEGFVRHAAPGDLLRSMRELPHAGPVH